MSAHAAAINTPDQEDDDREEDDLGELIDHYEQALQVIESTKKKPSDRRVQANPEQILEVLISRDRVQQNLEDQNGIADPALITRITALDQILRELIPALVKAGDFAGWRSSVQPSESAWWWQAEAPVKVRAWDRLDWFWNTLTAASLAVTASFSLTILQAISIGGFSWQASLGTIAQGAGLALVGGGALTSDGQKKVQSLLSNLNIPPELYSEVSFAASLTLLGTFAWVYDTLPNIFYTSGLQDYEAGDLADAQEKFMEALQLDPGLLEAQLQLGTVYESLGNFDDAMAQYGVLVQAGVPRGFNNLGRIFIQRIDPDLGEPDLQRGETYLRMGLQRVQSRALDPLTDRDKHYTQETQYQLHRNLGWALLAQGHHQEAAVELQKAIDIDENIAFRQLGTGVAYCLMAKTQQSLGYLSTAQNLWQDCQTEARPETVTEYQWIVDHAPAHMINCVDTSGVVTGLNHLPVELDPNCKLEADGNRYNVISDAKVLNTLKTKVQGMIQSKWDNSNITFTNNLPYALLVTSEGTVANYVPMTRMASDFDQNLPLTTLYAESPTQEGNLPEGASLAEFMVTFSPQGTVTVEPIVHNQDATSSQENPNPEDPNPEAPNP